MSSSFSFCFCLLEHTTPKRNKTEVITGETTHIRKGAGSRLKKKLINKQKIFWRDANERSYRNWFELGRFRNRKNETQTVNTPHTQQWTTMGLEKGLDVFVGFRIIWVFILPSVCKGKKTNQVTGWVQKRFRVRRIDWIGRSWRCLSADLGDKEGGRRSRKERGGNNTN